LAKGEHEGHTRQARLREDEHHDGRHASKVRRNAREGGELGDEKHDEDDEELATDQELLELGCVCCACVVCLL